MTFDGMHFCLAPRRPFVMGDNEGGSDEQPQISVDLAYPYFIGRFPVTVTSCTSALAPFLVLWDADPETVELMRTRAKPCPPGVEP
jgi:hypothetical protein